MTKNEFKKKVKKMTYEEFKKRIKKITAEEFEKELQKPREQGPGWGTTYTTPPEKSRAAADYLIAHSGQPLDFDCFHSQFQITMDKGSQVFPYDTLNWHVAIQLIRRGYDYKLFCVETKPGERWVGKKRYILVDKEEKISWGNAMEKAHRSFNNEFQFYRGAYYSFSAFHFGLLYGGKP